MLKSLTQVNCFCAKEKSNIPIEVILPLAYTSWLQQQSAFVHTWLEQNHINPEENNVCLLPNEQGQLAKIIVTTENPDDFWAYAFVVDKCPEGHYVLVNQEETLCEKFAVGWALASYQFTVYKKADNKKKQLAIELNPIQTAIIESIYLVRDLINLPSEDCNPQHLLLITEQLAQRYNAQSHQIVGEELLTQGFPAIHRVGRASQQAEQAPRLLELNWGNPTHKKITLVGKGVCFDTGGMNLKLGTGMRLMKKDMGGAAHVLGLANMIMAANLPIYLRVLIPAVENVVAANAYRPGDVITMRDGTTVEIENTDAEGRLILADALSYACEDQPELIIDFATLTGAARVAVGTEIAALFCNDDRLSQSITQLGNEIQDYIWPLPLHTPYQSLINSYLADIVNSSSSGYAGAITAALFLQRFIHSNTRWMHFDLMAWNVSAKPGRPEGGEAMALRGVFSYLQRTNMR